MRLTIKDNEFNPKIKIEIKELNDKSKKLLLEDIQSSFKNGKFLLRKISFNKNKIVIDLPLLFYQLGGKKFIKRWPELQDIPARFLTKLPRMKKVISENLEWKN